ncbi:hypothetical protein [Streptomyces buecherae]|uniref:hypothetical protein n=1 Tax=Streptomyces buecherae TaxID=2763006 RepID=UPI0037BB8A96
MPPTCQSIDNLFTGVPTDRRGILERDQAYMALLRLLDYARSLGDRTTPADLWRTLQAIPASDAFGSRERLHHLLITAEDDGEIRRTASGRILLRLDAPSTGGPEHVWVRLTCRPTVEVEITGADPWPEGQLHAPGPAWWHCTGCRDHSGTRAAPFPQVRAEATEHATACRALPAPPPSQ